MAGLLNDPKLAIAAAAWAAGSIAGGPAGGAIAALAAYGSYSAGQSFGSGSFAPTRNESTLAGLEFTNRRDKVLKGEGGFQGSIGGMSFDSGSKTSSRFQIAKPKTVNTFNIWVSNAADSRDSARAIERTLKKITLNGGSLVGVNDNR